MDDGVIYAFGADPSISWAKCIPGNICRVKDAGGRNDFPPLFVVYQDDLAGSVQKTKDISNLSNLCGHYLGHFELARKLLIGSRECGVRLGPILWNRVFCGSYWRWSWWSLHRNAVKLPRCDGCYIY